MTDTAESFRPRRNIVTRGDGRLVNVARPRGHLFICGDGCCCGRVEDGFPPLPKGLIHAEWDRRRLRNVVHLTIGGCLGPCALANVAMLLFDGESRWFHSVNSPDVVLAIYDYIEAMLDDDRPLPIPDSLAPIAFTAARWQDRPDGQPVDDNRPRRRPVAVDPASCPVDMPDVFLHLTPAISEAIAYMDGAAALPRKNGEIVFDAPWQARVFGMAVALNEAGVFHWEEFKQELINRVADAELNEERFDYFEIWLATFEHILRQKGIVSPDELRETAFQFEFGERDEVY